jgi:membrane-associated phospholipid phosphatase
VGLDYFNVPASNDVYNRGPIMNLVDSPSFPSGHTTYGYMGSFLLAVLVPDRYQETIVCGGAILGHGAAAFCGCVAE